MNSSHIANFDDESVARSIRAAEMYHRERQVPDPLDRKDCLGRPDLLAAAIRRRIRRGMEWGSPSTIKSPKITGDHRILIVLDPLAEVFFREKGMQLQAIDSHLSGNVLHARTSNQADVDWQIRLWREPHSEWKRLKTENRLNRLGSGVLDVKDHYPTISNEYLAELLQSHGIMDATVRDLVEGLVHLQSIPGMPQGLPVDMELSALLGTAALLPVDQFLLSGEIDFYRYVDDILLPEISEAYFVDVRGRIQEVLRLGGQELNETKTQWKGDLDVILPYATTSPKKMTKYEAASALRAAVDSGEFAAVPKAFAVLAESTSLKGLELIAEHPILLYRVPIQAMKYLRTISGQADLEKWEPLGELFPVNGSKPDQALAIVHLARCFPHRVMSEQLRRDVWDSCVSQGVEAVPAVTHFMVDLLFRSIRGRQIKRLRKEALELIDETVDLGFRRVLVGGFRYGGTPSASDADRLREIGKRDLDLACTVEWVLAA